MSLDGHPDAFVETAGVTVTVVSDAAKVDTAESAAGFAIARIWNLGWEPAYDLQFELFVSDLG